MHFSGEKIIKFYWIFEIAVIIDNVKKNKNMFRGIMDQESL